MAAAAPIIGIASGLFQIVSGVMGSSKERDSANEARAISERNAQRIEAETNEQARRTASQQAYERAETRARAGASGALLTSEGSHGTYQREQSRVHRENLEWIRASGASRAGIERMEGDRYQNIGNYRADKTLIGGLTSGAKDIWGTGVQAGWWGK